MKILQIAPRMPYPLTDGGAIGIYNITKFLAKAGHEVTLVTYPLPTREETDEALAELRQFAEVVVVSKPLPPRWLALLKSMFRGAYPIERRMMPEMTALLRRVASEKQFDILHVDHAHMGRYGLMLRREFQIPVILREHNFEAQIYERFAATERNPIKRRLAVLHGRRLRAEETEFLRAVDAVAAITQEDLAIIHELAPSTKVAVIPAGVDTASFVPTDSCEVVPNSVLWVGGMAWEPNRDALEYFLADFWPRVRTSAPKAILTIVGPGTEIVGPAAAKYGDSVRIMGQVPDIRDYLRRSAVVVVPLRIGGGMRVKLVEFFAAGKAVVSTSIGAEGNDAKDGVHLLIRESPASFADAVTSLIHDEALRRELGARARRLAEVSYSWESIAARFVSLYMSVLK